jgi:hypothetical protein
MRYMVLGVMKQALWEDRGSGNTLIIAGSPARDGLGFGALL